MCINAKTKQTNKQNKKFIIKFYRYLFYLNLKISLEFELIINRNSFSNHFINGRTLKAIIYTIYSQTKKNKKIKVNKIRLNKQWTLFYFFIFYFSYFINKHT